MLKTIFLTISCLPNFVPAYHKAKLLGSILAEVFNPSQYTATVARKNRPSDEELKLFIQELSFPTKHLDVQRQKQQKKKL